MSQALSYTAYARYAKKTGIAYAKCQRASIKAGQIELERVEEALHHIGNLYRIEEDIRKRKLAGADKSAHKQEQAAPASRRLFAWVVAQGFLPSGLFTKALAYARERRERLLLYLDDLDIDTNSLERALCAIPTGRKNSLFCWSELAAKQVGIVQSLVVTCRLHDIDPYD